MLGNNQASPAQSSATATGASSSANAGKNPNAYTTGRRQSKQAEAHNGYGNPFSGDANNSLSNQGTSEGLAKSRVEQTAKDGDYAPNRERQQENTQPAVRSANPVVTSEDYPIIDNKSPYPEGDFQDYTGTVDQGKGNSLVEHMHRNGLKGRIVITACGGGSGEGGIDYQCSQKNTQFDNADPDELDRVLININYRKDASGKLIRELNIKFPKKKKWVRIKPSMIPEGMTEEEAISRLEEELPNAIAPLLDDSDPLEDNQADPDGGWISPELRNRWTQIHESVLARVVGALTTTTKIASDGKLGESTWKSSDAGYGKAPLHLPPAGAGAVDYAIGEATDIIQLVKLGTQIYSSKETRDKIIKSVTTLNKEKVLKMLEKAYQSNIGIFTDPNANDEDKEYKMGSHAMTVLFLLKDFWKKGADLFLNILRKNSGWAKKLNPDLQDKIGEKFGRGFDSKDGKPEISDANIRQKHEQLGKDLEENPELVEAMNGNPDLLDSHDILKIPSVF